MKQVGKRTVERVDVSLDLPRPYSSSQDDGKLVNGYRPLLVTQDCKAN